MYWTLFLTFMKIGMFTIGGGYAMLPLIQREVVDRGWMSKEEFVDIFAVAQSLPGIFAVNISIFVGYRLKKKLGGCICALGTILPSFMIILLIALCFTQVKDNVWVEKAFKGLRPAVDRSFDQAFLQATDHSGGCGFIDLVRRCVSGLDHFSGDCGWIILWIE